MFRDWKKFEQLAREVLVKKSCALLSAPDVNVNISVLDKNGNRLPITAKCYKAGNEGSDILIHDDRPIVGQKILAQVKDYTSECGEIAMVRAFANKVDHERAHKGILVTTFKRFSNESHDLAKQYRIELVTANEFKGWMTEVGIKGDLSDEAREVARKEKEEMREAQQAAKRQKNSAGAGPSGS